MTYHIFGDYGYTSECELEAFTSYSEAKRWLDRYTRYGDLGGYSVIEIATFSADGEYITHDVVRADDLEWAA